MVAVDRDSEVRVDAPAPRRGKKVRNQFAWAVCLFDGRGAGEDREHAVQQHVPLST